MFGEIGSLTNTAPITGGHAGPATSGNGQTNTSSGFSGGVINMGSGVPWWAIALAVAVALYVVIKK